MHTTIVVVAVLNFCVLTVPLPNIYWTNLTQYASFLTRLEPQGLFEGVRPLFSCKMYLDHKKIWRSGWFEFRNESDATDCRIGLNGKEYKNSNFLVLMFPQGAISWIPFTGRVPFNVVNGGHLHRYQTSPLCRAHYLNSLLPGTLYSPDKLCCVPLDGKELVIRDIDKIEILTRNSYGDIFDEIFPKS